MLRKTVLAQVCGIGPGAICSWKIENPLEDLTTLLALFRVGAVAFPLSENIKPEKKDYFEKELGIGYFFENKKWNELKNNEVYSWFQPPGPGVLFYHDQSNEFVFHSEKKLILAAKDCADFHALEADSNILSMASIDQFIGLSLYLLPAIVIGSSLSLIKESSFFNIENRFSHLLLDSNQLQKFSNNLKDDQMIIVISSEKIESYKKFFNLKLSFVIGHYKLSPLILSQSKDYEIKQISNFKFKIENGEIFASCPYISPLLVKKNDVLRFITEEWASTGLKGKLEGNRIKEIAL